MLIIGLTKILLTILQNIIYIIKSIESHLANSILFLKKMIISIT